MPPMYWSTAIQYFARASTMLFFWSGQAKRMKYQDESTKVSMVSVSRLAALQHHGQIPVRDGDVAAGIAVDNRDRRAPVALPRDAPVAKAPGDLLVAEAFR